MRNKTLLISAAIIIIFIVGAIIYTFSQGSRQPEAGQNVRGTIEISQVIPAQDTNHVFLPVQQIAFVFSMPLDENGLIYRVEPNVPTYTQYIPNTNQIILSPTTAWRNGITTITILTRTKGINGRALRTAYVYKINTGIPAADSDANMTETDTRLTQ